MNQFIVKQSFVSIKDRMTAFFAFCGRIKASAGRGPEARAIGYCQRISSMLKLSWVIIAYSRKEMKPWKNLMKQI